MKNRNALVCPITVATILLALVALPGCAARDAVWVNENLSLTENFHSGTKVLATPLLPGTGSHEARLQATGRTRGNRRGADIALIVRAEFKDFSFLDRVSFASGRAFPLTVEKRINEDCGTTDKSLCNVHEFVTIKLQRKYLVAKRASGFDVKLWGRRDSVRLFVPGHYIKGLLSRMEKRQPEDLAAPAIEPVPASPAPGSTTRR